jgi:hypothetical protein
LQFAAAWHSFNLLAQLPVQLFAVSGHLKARSVSFLKMLALHHLHRSKKTIWDFWCCMMQLTASASVP